MAAQRPPCARLHNFPPRNADRHAVVCYIKRQRNESSCCPKCPRFFRDNAEVRLHGKQLRLSHFARVQKHLLAIGVISFCFRRLLRSLLSLSLLLLFLLLSLSLCLIFRRLVLVASTLALFALRRFCLSTVFHSCWWNGGSGKNFSCSRGLCNNCRLSLLVSTEVFITRGPLSGGLFVDATVFLEGQCMLSQIYRLVLLTSSVPFSFIFFFSKATGPMPHLRG